MISPNNFVSFVKKQYHIHKRMHHNTQSDVFHFQIVQRILPNRVVSQMVCMCATADTSGHKSSASSTSRCWDHVGIREEGIAGSSLLLPNAAPYVAVGCMELRLNGGMTPLISMRPSRRRLSLRDSSYRPSTKSSTRRASGSLPPHCPFDGEPSEVGPRGDEERPRVAPSLIVSSRAVDEGEVTDGFVVPVVVVKRY